MAAAADGDFKAGILCCGRGLVGVQFAINRRGYTVGDTVEFSVIVDNQSQRKLHEIKVALVQVTSLISPQGGANYSNAIFVR